MAMLSSLDLIRRVPLFSMLSIEQAQAIADAIVKRRYRRGRSWLSTIRNRTRCSSC